MSEIGKKGYSFTETHEHLGKVFGKGNEELGARVIKAMHSGEPVEVNEDEYDTVVKALEKLGVRLP